MYIIYFIDYMNDVQYNWYMVSNRPSAFMGPVLPSECEWIVPGTIGPED